MEGEDNKLTCLVIGDPHFKVTEMKASIAMGKEILRIATEQQPDFIVCLGDTLDRHETIHTDPLCEAVSWLLQLKKIAPVYLLIGNHDRPNNSDFLSSRHPFTAIKEWPGIVVVDQVMVQEIKGQPFFFVPYVPPGRLQEALDTIGWSPTGYHHQPWVCGFTHQEIYGIKMGTIISEKGDQWPTDWPLLINGHIHDRDIPQPNVISIGTPRQHAFGESPDKALSVFIFHQKNIWQEEKIPLNLPKKIIHRLMTKEFLTYTPPGWSEDCPLTDDLKIEIYGTGADIQACMKLEKVKVFRKMGIKIVTKDLDARKNKENIDLDTSNIVINDTPFRERLAQRVRGDEEVEKVYKRIFGLTQQRSTRKVKITRK